MADKGKPPTDLSALFAGKGKKKPKAMNLNADKPPEPEKPKLRSELIASGELVEEEGWERILRGEKDLMKSCGLVLKEVEADGACLFRAFADQITGNVDEHTAIRERCVDFMEANRADFEPFLEEQFEEYCRRMRQPATWGGHVEVQALARCNGINAVIYQPAEAAGEPKSLSKTSIQILTSDKDDTRCVQLCFHPKHHHGQHYNSVRCEADDGSGPAATASLEELNRRIEDALAPKAAPAKAAEASEEPAAAGRRKPAGKAF